MKVKVKELEGNQVELSVEVEAEEAEKAVARAYKKIASQLELPGFRKGKIPRDIIDARVGKEAVLEEAKNELVDRTYYQAVIQEKIKPIDRPEITDVQIAEGKPLKYKAKVEVQPKMELPDFSVVKVDRPEVTVSEEDVNSEMEKLRERFARLETTKTRPAQKGDYALISFTGYVDGKEHEKASMQDYMVEIGSNTLMPPFEDHLLGTRAGDIKEFSIHFPENHHEKSIAGKDVQFRVIVKEIKEKLLPELDDEFARQIGSFESLDELRKLLRDRLKEINEQQAEADLNNEIVKQYVDAVEVEIPEKMIDREIDEMVTDLAYQLAQQGMTFDEYMAYLNQTPEQMRESMKGDAEKRVKTRLVLEALAEKEGIKVSEEVLEEEIKLIAERTQKTPEEVRKILEERNDLGMLAYDVLLRKAYYHLVEEVKKSLGLTGQEVSEDTKEEENE